MWAKLDDGFADHPKIEALSDKAFRSHIRGICYAAKHLTDGFIPQSVAERLGGKRERNELVRGGVWHEVPLGYQVHDWLEYNLSREAVLSDRERARKRRSSGGRSGERPATADTPDGGGRSGAPSRPSPSPEGSPGVDLDDLAASIRTEDEEAADVSPPRPSAMLEDLGSLEQVLTYDQRALLAKIVIARPAFRDLKPGFVERLKRDHGNANVTEALRRLIQSLPDRVDRPQALLEEVVREAAADGSAA